MARCRNLSDAGSLTGRAPTAFWAVRPLTVALKAQSNESVFSEFLLAGRGPETEYI